MIANNLDDFPSQVEYRRKEIALRDGLGDDYGEAEALSGLAQGLEILGDTDEAWEALRRSLALHQSAGRLAPAAEVLQQLSRNSRTSGEFSAALDEAYQALALARQAGDKRRERDALFAVGATHFSLGEYDATIETYKRGAALNPDPNAQAEAWLFIGATRIRLGDYDAAVPDARAEPRRLDDEGLARQSVERPADARRPVHDAGRHRLGPGGRPGARARPVRAGGRHAPPRPRSRPARRWRDAGWRKRCSSSGRLDEAEPALAQAAEVVERNSDPIARAAILAVQANRGREARRARRRPSPGRRGRRRGGVDARTCGELAGPRGDDGLEPAGVPRRTSTC